MKHATPRNVEDDWSDVPPRWIPAAMAATLVYFFLGTEFLGFALWVVGNELSNHGDWVSILYFLGTALLFTSYNKGNWFWGLLLALGLPLLLLLISSGVASLASNGAGGAAYDPSWPYRPIEDVLVAGVLWFVFGVPRRGHVRGIDQDGEGRAQHFVVSVCTVLACALSGAFVLILHFGGGPLGRVDIGPLVVGTVYAVFLVAPLYRATATRCWKHGVLGLIRRSDEGKARRFAAVRELRAGDDAYARQWLAESRAERDEEHQAEGDEAPSEPTASKAAGRSLPASHNVTKAPPVKASRTSRKRKRRRRK